MRRSSSGDGDAAAHARHHGERAVLLNIGVYAIVDEARRAVFVMIAAPQHVEHVAQRGLADFAALAVAVNVQHFLHGLQLLAAHDLAQLLIGERTQAHSVVRVSSWNSGATARSSCWQSPVQLPQLVDARVRCFSCRQRVDAVFVNRLDDVALA